MAELSIARIRSHLQDCGYKSGLICGGIAIPQSDQTATVAFFEHPADARSACIAVITTPQANSIEKVAACRDLGAPVLLAVEPGGLEFWQQCATGPHRVESMPPNRVAQFFSKNRRSLEPAALYRAKTRSRFEDGYQISFVDQGLMPVVEQTIGEELSRLVERLIVQMREALGAENITEERGRWMFQSIFWLLAAKILKDKGVPSFAGIDIADPPAALGAVANHYHAGFSSPKSTNRENDALRRAGTSVSKFASLAHATTESLAYLYESALITDQTRRELGTHSTPTFLVDYIVASVSRLIEDIPAEKRDVFEPAAGHAGFLVAAMRLLRSLVPDFSPNRQRLYLRDKLHGIEKDAFAAEIGKLSLTLADAPNPNGWDLATGDMFSGDRLASKAAQSMILLCNPPFEQFDTTERAAAEKGQPTKLALAKSTEVLARTLPALPDNAVVGVVIPKSFLQTKNAQSVRAILGTQFEIREITLFPDKVFSFSSAETAIIIARKVARGPSRNSIVRLRCVRERDMASFRNDYKVTTDRKVLQSRFDPSSQYHAKVMDKISMFGPEVPVFISAIALGEIEFGHCVSGDPHRKEHAEFNQFIRTRFPMPLDISRSTAKYYGDIRARLFERFAPKDKDGRRRKGLRVAQLKDPVSDVVLGVDENDVWSAAHALEYNLVLVTQDGMRRIREVSRDLLRIENWLAG